MKKIVKIILILNLTVFPPRYANTQDFDFDLLNKISELIDESINNNEWEKAYFLFMALDDAIHNYKLDKELQKEQLVKEKLDQVINQNLYTLYTQGIKYLNQKDFPSAVKVFGKISYYNPEFKDVEKLLYLSQELKVINQGIKGFSHIVASPVINKKITGLRIYKPNKCFNGYTLFTQQGLYESLPLKHIYLIDMKGNIRYEWTVKGDPLFARLDKNGHLYICEKGIRELDFKSNIIWKYNANITHEFQILDENKFLIERVEKTLHPIYGIPCENPRIEIIDRNKHILWQWKGEEHIEELKKLTDINVFPIGDWAHLNSCEILPDNPIAKRDKRFRKGNILFSLDKLCTIGIIDYQTKKIVWAWGPGFIRNQHTPIMLENGHILVFDNGTYYQHSRIIELDPLTEKIVWEYHAQPEKDFYSYVWGNAQPLPNGNILVIESTQNRIFEITPDGKIVWDFISTFGTTTGCHGIYRAYRYSIDYVKKLLKNIVTDEKN